MHPTPIAAIVGTNLAAIRTRYGLTTDQVAQTAKLYGLRWTDSRVSAMERGRIPATLPTLFALAQTLGDVTGHRVSIADLVDSDGWVEINNDLGVSAAALRTALEGVAIDLKSHEIFGSADDAEDTAGGAVESLQRFLELPTTLQAALSVGRVGRARLRAGASEERIAQQLGIDQTLMAAMSLHIWGRTLSEERDRRAGETANAQRRGQVARALKQELKRALETINGND